MTILVLYAVAGPRTRIAHSILVRNGAMTAEMMALRHGLEPPGESQSRR